MKLIVFHAYYPCDSGCCGHAVKIDDNPLAEPGTFTFSHPGEDRKAFAEDLIRQHFGEEHVKDLDWDRCVISDD